MAKKNPDVEAWVLARSEYPASITAPSFPGANPPKVIFAAQHPLGLTSALRLREVPRGTR